MGSRSNSSDDMPDTWEGSTNSDSINEKISVQITTMGITFISLPSGPGNMIKGANAMMVVSTEKMTGFCTSWAPSIAPLTPVIPWRCLLNTFSPTIMASSTTMPSTNIKANNEIIFKEPPKLGNNINAPIKEMGIPRVTQNESCARKNKSRITNTKAKPLKAFSLSRSIRLLK